jgi:RimJ/RimL family protein N-acetyltransferase
VKPVTLTTDRLVLDELLPADRDLVVEYCRDPLFEKFMLTPWPYEPKHADMFIDNVAPVGWQTEREFTWAIRRDGVFLGVIGYRELTGDIGYWLGAPHRGHGYMPEAVAAVLDWLFATGHELVLWECVAGNAASLSVARSCGFRYTGEGPSALGSRDGKPPLSWHGELRATDDRTPKPGWPA